MKRVFLAAAVLVLVACGGTPVSFIALAPQPAQTSYDCALRKVNELQYTVTNTNREAGFIQADHQASGLATKLFTGSEYHDQLTISVFGDSASGGRKMRVTAARTKIQANLFGNQTGAESPSEPAKAAANEILRVCGTGPVSVQEGEVEAR